ncbi:Mitochondrial ornithine transporter 1 [Orchesella cincta]|uniref:Mitochondrial ornithine transporter 1 n=1 Tax=Orchesella cincta TaxID=48709 RepID=A0A1D2N4Y7_ORCCI|nr:Mitochondrial ornithine transporter 1 [Orchesella cincta]
MASYDRVILPSLVESKASHGVKDIAIDLLAGTAGGTACVYVGQPLDTVKVKMQTFPQMYSKGMIDCLLTTFRKDGIRRGLYAGTVPALVANISENATLFAAYGVCQKAVAVTTRQKVEEMSPIYHAVSGFLAGFFSSLTLCPTELVKCRLQAMRETSAISSVGGGEAPLRYIGPATLCKQILREEGFRGFFHGLSSTFAREMPGYFFFFGGYELSRYLLTPKGKTKDEIGPLRTILCGGIGGTLLWVLIFPTDVVKSRIQINRLNITLLGCLKDIIRHEGVKALYNGLGPTLIRTFPATGALFLAYEYTKKAFNSLTQNNYSIEQ